MKYFREVVVLLIGILIGLLIGWLFWVRPAFATREPLACATQCIASECGTTEGTKMEVEESYEYANAICPLWYHYHNDGNWNQRCHRDFHWMQPEHKAPTGCPEGFSQYENSCRKVIQECVSVKCDDAQIIECEPTITPTPPVYDPEVNCTTQCGIGGDVVADGKGGFKTCPVNPPCGGGGETPRCNDNTPLTLPANVHVKRSGSDATVNFFTNSSNANIYFKEVNSPVWQHSARDIAVTGGYVSYTIHDLVPALGYTFGVQAANSCAGGETVLAVVVDGPLSVTFPLSYWEWLK